MKHLGLKAKVNRKEANDAPSVWPAKATDIAGRRYMREPYLGETFHLPLYYIFHFTTHSEGAEQFDLYMKT